MWPNPQETADLVSFTEEILNGAASVIVSNESEYEHASIPQYLHKIILKLIWRWW